MLTVPERDEVRSGLVAARGRRKGELRSPVDAWRPRCYRIASPVAISGETAVVGGVTQTVRWTYTATEVRWNVSAGEWQDVDGGLVIIGATNTNEDHNSSTVLGPGYLVANIPAGFEYCAVGLCADAEAIEVVVMACPQIDSDDTTYLKFWHPNTLDGVCAA